MGRVESTVVVPDGEANKAFGVDKSSAGERCVKYERLDTSIFA